MTTSVNTNAVVNYTFGAINISIGVVGDNVDRPKAMADHMQSAAIAIAGTGIINAGISDQHRDDTSDSTHEKYESTITFGNGITLTTEVKIDAAGHISKRKLNTLALAWILPKTMLAAAIYLGDSQTRTSPPSPLPSRPLREVSDNIDKALALIAGDGSSFTSAASGRSDSYQSDQDSR